jgi:uncharacterized protein with PQ loop repeat
MVTILAWTGAFLSCVLTIPQAVRTLRSDRLDGLSATTYWIIFANAVVWASWSTLSGEYAAGVPSLVNGPAALLILRRLDHTQRSDARVTHLRVPPCKPGARTPSGRNVIPVRNKSQLAGSLDHPNVVPV